MGWLNKVRWGLGFAVLFRVLLGFLTVGFPSLVGGDGGRVNFVVLFLVL